MAVGAVPASENALPVGIATLVNAASEILVMSPSLPGRLDFLTNDTARARQLADERLADVLGRTFIAPAQLPAGTLTALIGTPYFAWLLWRSRVAG